MESIKITRSKESERMIRAMGCAVAIGPQTKEFYDACAAWDAYIKPVMDVVMNRELGDLFK